MKIEAMYKRYGNKKPIATMAFCNTFGVQFYEPDENDSDSDLICCWYNGEYGYGYHKHLIHYTATGRAFIKKGGIRIYLDETMKRE